MKIVFNGIKTGFSNNGGSQTIMLLALELAKREHVVEIWSDSHNQHTWNHLPEDDGDEHPNKIVNPRFRRLVEPTRAKFDIAFAVGSNAMDTTRKIKARAMVNWVRNIETWRKPEAVLAEEFADRNFETWTNSGWIADWIKDRTGRICDVVYPCFKAERCEPGKLDGKAFKIGFINAHQFCNPDRRIRNCIDTVMALRKIGVVEAAGFGSMGPNGIYDKYLQHPSFDDKIALMQSCDLWMASNPSRGLSLSSAEASLCGIPVLAPRARECGVHDWFPLELKKKLLYDTIDEAVAAATWLMAMPRPGRRLIGSDFRKKAENKFKSDKRAADNIEKRLTALI